MPHIVVLQIFLILKMRPARFTSDIVVVVALVRSQLVRVEEDFIAIPALEDPIFLVIPILVVLERLFPQKHLATICANKLAAVVEVEWFGLFCALIAPISLVVGVTVFTDEGVVAKSTPILELPIMRRVHVFLVFVPVLEFLFATVSAPAIMVLTAPLQMVFKLRFARKGLAAGDTRVFEGSLDLSVLVDLAHMLVKRHIICELYELGTIIAEISDSLPDFLNVIMPQVVQRNDPFIVGAEITTLLALVFLAQVPRAEMLEAQLRDGLLLPL